MGEEGGDAQDLPGVIRTQLHRLGVGELYDALHRAECPLASEWRAAHAKFQETLEKHAAAQARRKGAAVAALARFTWSNKGELADTWFLLCGATQRVAELVGFDAATALDRMCRSIHALGIVPPAALPINRFNQKVRDYLNGGAYNGSRSYQMSAEVREVAEGRRTVTSTTTVSADADQPLQAPPAAAPPAPAANRAAAPAATSPGRGGRRGRGRGRGVAQVISRVEEIDDDSSWDWDLVHQVPAPSPRPAGETAQGAPAPRAAKQTAPPPPAEAPKPTKGPKSPKSTVGAKGRPPAAQRAAKNGSAPVKESTAEAYVRTAKQASGPERRVRFADGVSPAGVSRGAPPPPPGSQPAAAPEPPAAQLRKRSCHPMRQEVMASALAALRDVKDNPKLDKDAALRRLESQMKAFADAEAAAGSPALSPVPQTPPPEYATPATKRRRVEGVSRNLDASFASQPQAAESQDQSQSQDVNCSPPPPYPASQSTQ
eukprot:Hpha_TRINITY_DN13460_c0_g1::TRINITY_DN13460_c0_g1_i1::g.131292::m.131292